MPDFGSKRERLIYLDKHKLINCGRCKPNRGDNAKRRGTDDKGKNHRRKEGPHKCRWKGFCRRCNPKAFKNRK